MCGIAGFFDGNADFTANREKYENILRKMQQSILHRGPDEQGIYLGKRAGLAHTRLSIIDLKDGSQPMSRRRGKNSYQIVYNGEIYNAGELRKTLQQKGWRFQTTSDTEVILLAFWNMGRSLSYGLMAFLPLPFWMNGMIPYICIGILLESSHCFIRSKMEWYCLDRNPKRSCRIRV